MPAVENWLVEIGERFGSRGEGRRDEKWEGQQESEGVGFHGWPRYTESPATPRSGFTEETVG